MTVLTVPWWSNANIASARPVKPRALRLPNVSELRKSSELPESDAIPTARAELLRTFPRSRRVRGDGNCYFRALAFGALEASASPKVMALLREMRFTEARHAQDHEALLSALSRLDNAFAADAGDEPEAAAAAPLKAGSIAGSWGADAAAALVASDALDLAMVRACRRLVADHIRAKLDEPTAGGLTYREIIGANIVEEPAGESGSAAIAATAAAAAAANAADASASESGSASDAAVGGVSGAAAAAAAAAASDGENAADAAVQRYLAREVESMGVAAEGFWVEEHVLAGILGVSCTIVLLDQRRSGGGGLCFSGAALESGPDVTLFLQNGHYDLVYASAEARGGSGNAAGAAGAAAGDVAMAVTESE